MSPPLLEHNYMGRGSGALSTEASSPDLRGTELRLGLPGSESPERKHLTLELLPPSAKGKRGFAELKKDGGASGDNMATQRKEENCAKGKMEEKKPAGAAPAAKAQVVGWPPIRNYRKNTMAINPSKNKEDAADTKQAAGCFYVKVSMDGAPYLRKVDLQTYKNYRELSTALEKMFSGFTSGKCDSNGSSNVAPTDLIKGSEFVLTYEDKDGDWMLVGDVPWEMFADSCRRLRIMKGSDAIGLGFCT